MPPIRANDRLYDACIAPTHTPRRRIGHVSPRGWTLRRRLLALYVVVAGFVLVGVIGSLLALRTATRLTNLVESALSPAQIDAARLAQTYRDLDAGVRVLQGTSQDAALRPVVANRRRIDQLVADLDRRLAHEPALLLRLAQVQTAASRWLADAVDAAIAQAQAPSSTPASPSTATGAASTATDADRFATIRSAIDSFSDAVGQREAIEQRAANRADRVVAALLLAGSGLFALTGASLFVLLHRNVTRPLDALVGGISTVAGGNLETAIPVAGAPELAAVGHAAEAMRQRLLDDAAGRINSALIAGQEMERRRIAGQIHDDQVQAMTAASLRLQQLRRRLGDGDERLREPLAAAEETTNQATTRLRRMIFELYSPVLETDGLLAALEVYLDETFVDDTEWHLTGATEGLPPAIAALAYRLARETLWNVVKHAHAHRVDVVADADGTGVTVTIADDGVGFEPGEQQRIAAGHLGINYSRDLARAAGGWWFYSTEPGQGTTVRFRLPAATARARE